MNLMIRADARAPLPPFTRETALLKVRMAENAWNPRDPVRVSLAYTEDCRWPAVPRPADYPGLSDLRL